MSLVVCRTWEAPPVQKQEILRYAGAGKSLTHDGLMEECLREVQDRLTYRSCHCVLPVSAAPDGVLLGDLHIPSLALQKNLQGCARVVLFAATVGIEMDRMIAKYSALSPAKALWMQAIGAERIESLCDCLCAALKETYGAVCPRFSPGYGDLSIEWQAQLFRLLDCGRKIGLTLNQSMLMSPSKSVTAFVGIR